MGSAAPHGQGSRQGGLGTDAGHERGSGNDDGSKGIGRARRTTVVQGRKTGRRRLEGGSRQGRLRGV